MEIRTVEPLTLFNRNRLDLIVKYLFAKEILERENNSYLKNVYKDLYIINNKLYNKLNGGH